MRLPIHHFLSALVTLGAAYAVFVLYQASQASLATLLLVLTTGFAIVFFSRRFYSMRFYYPAVVGLVLFALFPVVYTSYVGFTNYGGSNLLTHKQIERFFTQQTVVDTSSEQPFEVAQLGARYQVWLPEAQLLSDPFTLGEGTVQVDLYPAAGAPAKVLATRELVKLRTGFKKLELKNPEGLVFKTSGLKTVAQLERAYVLQEDGSLLSHQGKVYTPNHDIGYFVNEEGQAVKPGWRTWIGTGNFEKVIDNPGIREPMVQIFTWTVIFALLSMVGTFALGLLLAVVLQWKELKGKAVYRILLILPYAVPAFISILVFKGLFNQNFGEINFILEALFGITPEWNTNPFLAKTMILIVNLWLGYPYMMLLAMGYLQSVPEDHYKAAAIEGAGTIRQFFSITLPQILPPFVPMLIANFAFNFNNLVLIVLLTRGAPDIPGTLIPAGQTDILASFTYRIAFMDSSQDFGLAGAISMMMFLLVAVIAYFNLMALRRMARGTQ